MTLWNEGLNSKGVVVCVVGSDESQFSTAVPALRTVKAVKTFVVENVGTMV